MCTIVRQESTSKRYGEVSDHKYSRGQMGETVVEPFRDVNGKRYFHKYWLNTDPSHTQRLSPKGQKL